MCVERRDRERAAELLADALDLDLAAGLDLRVAEGDAVGLEERVGSSGRSVDLAIALASPLLAATRSVTAVVPPPRSLETFARVHARPARSSAPLAALPVTTFLVFGSQARTLTVFGCCTPLMRGRNEISRVLALERRPARRAPLLAGRNSSVVSLDDDLEVVHQREPPGEVPVGLVALLEELVDDAGGRRPSAVRPASPAIFLTMSEADTCWNVRVLRCAVELVRLVVGADRDDARPAGANSGSTAAIWPLKIDVVARLALSPDTLISRSLPSCSGWLSIVRRPSGP